MQQHLLSVTADVGAVASRLSNAQRAQTMVRRTLRELALSQLQAAAATAAAIGTVVLRTRRITAATRSKPLSAAPLWRKA